jgi:hypothetical protein
VRRAQVPDAKAFVAAHHYSGTHGTRGPVYTFGLFRRDRADRILGAAIWGTGLPRSAAETFSPDWRGVLSLTRLAVAPEVPLNGASFLIARSVREIRKEGRYHTLATYADTWQEHTGGIYRATNWQYLGETKPTAVWVDSDGRVVANRRPGPSANQGRGGAGLASSDMEALGHRFVGRFPKHKFRMVLDAKKAGLA